MTFLSIYLPHECVNPLSGEHSPATGFDEVKINLSAIAYLRSEICSDETYIAMTNGENISVKLPIAELVREIEDAERKDIL